MKILVLFFYFFLNQNYKTNLIDVLATFPKTFSHLSLNNIQLDINHNSKIRILGKYETENREKPCPQCGQYPCKCRTDV